MAREYYPFDSGAGSGPTDQQWRRMARLWAPTSVETGLAVSIGTGSNVNLSAGSAWVDGHYYRETTATTIPFTANALAQPQLARVVLRLDTTANTIVPACTTAALVQNPDGIYEMQIAEFTLPPSGQTQTPTALTDKRVYMSNLAGHPLVITSAPLMPASNSQWVYTDSLANAVLLPANRGLFLSGSLSVTLPELVNDKWATVTLEQAPSATGPWSAIRGIGWSRVIIPAYANTVSAHVSGFIAPTSAVRSLFFRAGIRSDYSGQQRLDDVTLRLDLTNHNA